MFHLQVSPVSSRLSSLKYEIVKQSVRAYKTIVCEADRALMINEKTQSEVSPPDGASMYFHNRNPRNLERLAIANKGHGWVLEKDGRTFWHKLIITQSSEGVKVSCVHQSGKVVMSASSSEWCIRKFLSKKSDKSAYMNVGRVFAQRCLQSGLYEMCSYYSVTPEGKTASLIKEIEEGGVSLYEPIQMRNENWITKVKPKRPWDIIVE